LFRRLIILFLFTAGIVLWLTVLYQAKSDFPYLLMLIFSVTAVGLASGFGARLALGERSRLLRLVAALASVVLGLYGLGFLTDWKMGLGPLEFWRDEIDYREAAQLGGGTIAALVALTAWRRPVRFVEAARQRPAARSAPIESYRAPAATPPRTGLASLLRPATRVSPSARSMRPTPSRRGRPASAPLRPVERLSVRRPARSRRRGVFRRKPEVQFSMYEEHKCPYCLEDVKRNDPRGVKECPVCHTLHHADCWSITGMCQVPHLNT